MPWFADEESLGQEGTMWMKLEILFMPSQGDKRLAYGKLNEVGSVVDIQFIHQVGFVPFYRLGANNKHVSYFSSGMSLNN